METISLFDHLPIEVGDKVEILWGSLKGRIGTVYSFNGDMYTVKTKRFSDLPLQYFRYYELRYYEHELKLISKKNSGE